MRWLIAGLLAIGLAGGVLAQAVPRVSTFAAAVYKTSAECHTVADRDGPTSRKAALGGIVCGVIDSFGQVVADRMTLPSQPARLSKTAPAYPLKVGATGRYLVDQNNTPFLVVGDSPQAMVGNVSMEDAAVFLSNRQKYGFNTVWVNLLCNDKTGCRPDGNTSDGIAPFSTPGDLSTPNEAYFARVDQMIALAGKYGMNVLLDPIETSGWTGTLQINGKDRAYAFGRYLGQRYVTFPNIIWMSGNDFQSWRDAGDDTLALAVAQGIKDTDPVHLQTLELDYFVSASLDDPNWAPIVQLDAVYTYRPTYAKVSNEYNRAQPLPIFMVEATYEWEGDYGGPQTLRREEYWSLLSGASGQLYGNKYTWPFAQDWKRHLDTLGSAQMTYVTNLFTSRRWFDLVPDQDHTLLTDGYGAFTDAGKNDDSDYATAARTLDGGLAIVYMPTARTFTVDLNRLASPIQAHWYDPSNGRFSAIGDGPLPNSGPAQFQTPGKNGDGDPDWVLVIEANSAP